MENLIQIEPYHGLTKVLIIVFLLQLAKPSSNFTLFLIPANGFDCHTSFNFDVLCKKKLIDDECVCSRGMFYYSIMINAKDQYVGLVVYHATIHCMRLI